MQVWIIEDHPMVAHALEAILHAEFSDCVTVSAASLEPLDWGTLPEVAIVDLTLGGELKGYGVIHRILERSPRCKILVFSMHAESVYVRKAKSSGALGYLLKSDGKDEMLEAFRSIVNGYPWASRTVADQFLDTQVHREGVILSARELEVATHVADGKTSKEISEKLGISVRTVESHRHNLMKKLGTKNVAQLLVAIESGFRPLSEAPAGPTGTESPLDQRQ